MSPGPFTSGPDALDGANLLRMARAVIFDLDGTLVDSLADIAAATNACLEAAGFPTHPQERYREFVGDGLTALVRRALGTRGELESMCSAVATRYASACTERTRPYPGIEDILVELRRRGLRLGVLSNKPDPLTRDVTRLLFGPAAFDVVAGERPGTPRKPDPTSALWMARTLGVEPSECVFVGDSPVDLATAHAARMTAVAVSWGYRSAVDFEPHRPHLLVDRPESLLDLIASV